MDTNQLRHDRSVPRSPESESHLARIVSEVMSPPLVNAVILMAIALQDAPNLLRALGLGLLAVVFVSFIPMVVIVRGVRQQRLTDHHVAVREQRPLPFAITLLCVVLGWLVLIALQAPPGLVVLVGAMAVGLLVTLLVTLFWKISLHAACAATAVAVFTIVFGLPFLLLSPLVLLVSWARVARGSHSVAQVIGGIILGSTITPALFAFFR